MMTLEEIKRAHSKVRSGVDFPQYVQDIIGLGVRGYTTFVYDGHTDYYGVDGLKLSSEPRYENLMVAENAVPDSFKTRLKDHQEGKSDYFTFCKMCAQVGIDRWEVTLEEMTCTYHDQSGNVILVEKIPEVK